jgi:hypothetical protein
MAQGKGAKVPTSKADAARIFDYLAEVKAGQHVGNANVPVYTESDFGAATMEDYLTRIQPNYARQVGVLNPLYIYYNAY